MRVNAVSVKPTEGLSSGIVVKAKKRAFRYVSIWRRVSGKVARLDGGMSTSVHTRQLSEYSSVSVPPSVLRLGRIKWSWLLLVDQRKRKRDHDSTCMHIAQCKQHRVYKTVTRHIDKTHSRWACISRCISSGPRNRVRVDYWGWYYGLLKIEWIPCLICSPCLASEGWYLLLFYS